MSRGRADTWRGVGIAWNVLGIADLIIALAIGFVTLESVGGRLAR